MQKYGIIALKSEKICYFCHTIWVIPYPFVVNIFVNT